MRRLRIDPEQDDLNTIIREAIATEKAYDETDRPSKKDQKEGGSNKPKREWTRFKNRNGGTKHYKPGENESENKKSDKIRANAVSPQSTPQNSGQKPSQSANQNAPKKEYKDKGKEKSDYKHKNLSRSKMDALRAEGKCFNCQQQGHEQRNCPKLQSMKPPQSAIKAGTISFASMEVLASKKEKADMYVGSMSIIGFDPIGEEIREHEELEFQVHQMCEDAWGEDPLWYNEETRPDCKYSIEVNNEEITIWDFVNGENRTFVREKLNDPEFTIVNLFSTPDTYSTPTTVREGGFPVIDEYKQWEWPAINWLRA